MSMQPARSETRGSSLALHISYAVRAEAGGRGWSGLEVARRTGLGRQTIQRRISGETDWSLAELDRLLDAFDMELPELLKSHPNPRPVTGPRLVTGSENVEELPRLDLNQQPCGYPWPQVVMGPVGRRLHLVPDSTAIRPFLPVPARHPFGPVSPGEERPEPATRPIHPRTFRPVVVVSGNNYAA